MTPDTKRAAVERLAKEVMGWRYDDRGGLHPWRAGEADAPAATKFWDPFSNLSDAFMVAEKIGYLSLQHGKPENYWYANFNGTEFCNLTRNAKTAAEAISNAALAWLDARRKEGE